MNFNDILRVGTILLSTDLNVFCPVIFVESFPINNLDFQMYVHVTGNVNIWIMRNSFVCKRKISTLSG